MKKKYLIFIIFLVAINQVKSIDIDSIYVGDYLEITTKKQHIKDSVMSVISREIEIIDFKVDTIKKDPYKVVNKIIVTCYDSGIYVMNNPKSSILFNVDTIKVNNIKVDMSKDIKDIAEIINHNYSLKDYTKMILPYLIIIVLIIILLKLINKTKKSKDKKEENLKIKIPPHEKAISDLKKLQSSNLIDNKKYKIFYSILSDILRKYIEEKFIIQAMENSTQEIIKNLKNKTNIKNSELIKKILKTTDLVKYAKGKSNKKESTEIIKMSYDFIKKTIDE